MLLYFISTFTTVRKLRSLITFSCLAERDLNALLSFYPSVLISQQKLGEAASSLTQLVLLVSIPVRENWADMSGEEVLQHNKQW